jgi:dTDP-4-dehydrorhamnose reductase
MSLRVLVTGSGGRLGGRLAECLASEFPLVAARHLSEPPESLPQVRLDLLSIASLESAFDRARPDAVVHAAALGVDRCEADPAAAEALHVRATEALARLCRLRGVRLLALSTDLVLPGDRPFSGEADPARPLLTYGQTKLLGERAVLGADPGAAVLRVALVHGRGHGPGGTASEAIAWALRAGRTVRLFTDQYRTPVDPESVAAVLAALLRGGGTGLYHVGGPERLSRHDLGLRVARLLDLPNDLIQRVTQAEHAPGAPRPLDTSLDSGRARRELGWTPRELDRGLREGRREAV